MTRQKMTHVTGIIVLDDVAMVLDTSPYRQDFSLSSTFYNYKSLPNSKVGIPASNWPVIRHMMSVIQDLSFCHISSVISGLSFFSCSLSSRLRSFIVCPLHSAFCPQPFTLCLLPSAPQLLSFILRPLSSILCRVCTRLSTC